MRIKNISCTQFAGVRDRSISLADGINVIYGKNESGKSTLVNLLSRTLFQKAKLDGRSDKEFYELYFPGANKDSRITGDFADGKITFETEKGSYAISKEWGAESRCILSTPDGVIRDQKQIDVILKELLLYGEGVYSDMLFSSQRNTDISLKTILDASQKTDAKQEIVDVVSQAFVESDGLSVDAIEQEITAKIDEIAGKHWDIDHGTPARKTGGGRWSKDLGEILKAYYALKDAKDVLEEISHLESEADSAAQEYTKRDTDAHNAEEEYDKFNTFASRLAIQSERKKTITRIKQDLEKNADILSSWPKLLEKLEEAKKLQAEKANRELLDRYEVAKKISDELAVIDTGVVNRPYPSDTDIVQAKTAQRKVASLENKLCGINLSAAIQMLNENRIEIISLRTGETVELSGSIASITEAVKITVPGVMEMELSPADVDVTAIESQIAEQKSMIAKIFAKYGVESLDALESLAKCITETKAKIDGVKGRLSILLGETTFEELESAASTIVDFVRSKEDIESDIIAVCGGKDIEKFITVKETIVDGYTAEYSSINNLKAKAFDLEEEFKKAKESVSAAEDIPAEYLDIPDPDDYLEMLQRNLKSQQSLREKALTAKTAAASKLESYEENIAGDPTENVEQAEQVFEEQKSLLAHWLHIKEVFKEQKENIHDKPMQDIAEQFARYLAVITDGKVSSEFPEADKLNMNIYSENRLLDYGKLSEGTKETVSLAFRLSVLDHLFPNGGGVIVFDDPFTDMDAERAAQSCELVRECAKRHQVIFLTCREEYLDMLKGNAVQI